ncbi:MAG: hypothetical protein AAF620_01130 [Bacteroidota bacterium]
MAKSFKRPTSNYLDALPRNKATEEGSAEEKKPVQKARQKSKPKVQPKEQLNAKLSPELMDKLRDFVYTKRISGKFQYAQNNAIEDGLKLLFSQHKIVKRPKEIREEEEKKRNSIKQGKRK